MSELLFFNGINGSSGTYGMEPMTAQDFSDHIVGTADREPENLDSLKEKLKGDIHERIFDIINNVLAKEDVASRGAWRRRWPGLRCRST